MTIYSEGTFPRYGNNQETFSWGEKVFGRRLTESDLERIVQIAQQNATATARIDALQATIAAHLDVCDEDKAKRDAQHEQNLQRFSNLDRSIHELDNSQWRANGVWQAINWIVTTVIAAGGVAAAVYFHHG